MFNFFKRKKDKKKRGGRKERGQEVGVTAQRGDGQFATPVSVVSGGSALADQGGHNTTGSGAPREMGNDISKPISTLQGLPEIPFIEIDRVPVERVNKLPTTENVTNVPENKTKETEKTEQIQEMKTKMNELSQLQSPYLVKRVSESENMEKPILANFENSAECESECEKYVIRDEASPANETLEEKSVTGGDDTSLARKGSVASCEEYSSGEGGPVGTGIEGEMYRVTQGFESGGALSCGEVYDRIKSSSEGDLYSLKKNCEIVKNSESCTDDQAEESGDSSEGELSESEQSESDNIIKNDSGCWDQRESSLNLNENESQASQVTSLYSDSGVGEKSKEKKRVKWADIDGKRELTYAREGSIISSEESSEEEESDDEEPVKDKQEDDEDDSEDEEEEEDESEEDEEEDSNLTKVKIIDKSLKDNQVESASSEEESEEEHEEVTRFNEVTAEATPVTNQDKEEDSGDESEEESSAEESGNEDELKDDENPLKIDIAEMQNRIADLQRDISLKASNIDRLQVELDAACNESEMVRKRFKRLEADLDLYKETNRELKERINVSASQVVEKEVKNSKQLEEADRRIKELEAELAQVKAEISSLQSSYKKLEADRDMEVQIIQKALEKALTDQDEIKAKYESLRTLNSSREVEMLEDFEWKLREVQKACKKKMQDLETANDKKSSELVEKLAAAQADLEQISHLKLCEIELNQLKQTSSEQRKNLRLTNRKLEELQVSEKILQEEVHSLRASLDKEKSHVATLQALHREELIDKDRRAKLKLEVQINQLATEWEERLRRESLKVKTETERTLREEKNGAVELVKKLKDQEISQLKQTWEKKSQDLKKEIENYKKKISDMEDLKKIDFDKIQTNADREIFDLRRKMDKLDMSYQEKIEKIQEQHEKEMAALKEECDRRVQQSEANLQLQVGNSRTTIELVKQQLQNEAQLKLEHLQREYENKLQQQWERLNQEKEEALEKMEQSQKQSLELLYMEMEKMKKHSRAELEGKKKNQPSNQSPRMSSSQKKNSSSSDLSHSRHPISFANAIYIFFFLIFLYPFLGPTTTILTVLSILVYYFITYVYN